MMKFVKAFPALDLIRSFLWNNEYFDELLQIEVAIIQELKKENCKSNCRRCETCQRVKIEVEYLRASATHFHDIKDTKTMMKAFPTLDLFRSFLWNNEYFDELLQIEGAIIQELKKENCKSNCGRCETCQRVKIEVEYLRTSATHFRDKKDTKTMMKFVKAFPTLDLINSFLWNNEYFDELLQIEVANGDFVRAAEMAELKGDLLLQADMLEKAEKYEEAIRIILFHVQLNSLWGMKNRGWPLRQFPEKNKLLGEVKRIAIQNLQHVPDALDCKVLILLNESHNLSEITEQMILAQKMGNLNSEALSLRKVLDVHICSDAKKFQHEQVGSLLKMDYNSKMLLENRVSITTMMFLWNAWKDKLLSSVDSFIKLEKQPEKEEDKVYIEFAYEYFGARVSRNRSCTVFNSEAFWLNDRRLGLLQRQGNCPGISIQNFFMHARKFLLMELFSVGIEVVKKLQEIYLSCRNQHCMCKGTPILQIYQALKSLEERKLVRFDEDEQFFEIFFPLKTQYENLKEFISLRESPTRSVILEDITANIIRKIYRGINLGQIGRLQLLRPFWPKHLVTEYGKTIIKSLDDNNCWNNELLWLNTGDCLLDKRLCMIESFDKALHGTFQNWHNHIDYISPHIFLILLEKLFSFSYVNIYQEAWFCLDVSL
ncbi:hypothetical protein SUGI_0684370 [Cryptomeria japonica]|nr:hypothetical protein SUGI_0684370 [Cryptomeria japonica]